MTVETGDRSELFPAIERKHGQPVQFWFDELSRQGPAFRYTGRPPELD